MSLSLVQIYWLEKEVTYIRVSKLAREIKSAFPTFPNLEGTQGSPFRQDGSHYDQKDPARNPCNRCSWSKLYPRRAVERIRHQTRQSAFPVTSLKIQRNRLKCTHQITSIDMYVTQLHDLERFPPFPNPLLHPSHAPIFQDLDLVSHLTPSPQFQLNVLSHPLLNLLESDEMRRNFGRGAHSKNGRTEVLS